MKRTALATVALSGVLLATAGSAQEFTDAELMSRFLMQKEAISDARLGAPRSLTRGVELVTVDDVAPTVSATAPELAPNAPDPATGGVAVATAEDVRPQDPFSPIPASVHPDFPPQQQINIRIKFGFDSAAIDESQMPDLQQMCRVMHTLTDVNLFRIVGHTDASGAEDYNERLSRLRAEEVARFLVEDCGIKASRLETVGFGERFLSNPADPEADVNRRVEFQALS